jgi:hypothetical protein
MHHRTLEQKHPSSCFSKFNGISYQRYLYHQYQVYQTQNMMYKVAPSIFLCVAQACGRVAPPQALLLITRQHVHVTKHHARTPHASIRIRPYRTLARVREPPQSAVSERVSAPTHPSYELLSEDFIKEYGARTALYRHKKSGAEVLSVAIDDDNKVRLLCCNVARVAPTCVH